VALRQGLTEAGYVVGQNVAIEYRWAQGESDKLPKLVADLLRLQPAVIVVAGSTAGAVAAKAATTTVPIVFVIGGDPVTLGLLRDLNRPSGNVTGVSFFGNELGAKRLALLRELIPNATEIAILVNPSNPNSGSETKEVQQAAEVLQLHLTVVNARNNGEVDAAFAIIVRQQARGLLVLGDPFFSSLRKQLVDLAARHALPAIYTQREDTIAGGLMNYGTNFADANRQAGIYAGRILKGENPSDLPIMRSTKFQFVLNLKTAKSLGLEVPAKLLALADEVID
jgi:putative ABC transport system substrate-binding protein